MMLWKPGPVEGGICKKPKINAKTCTCAHGGRASCSG
eukprot:CAMPEP_0178544012 /NCGR_PEP_ID=MMETSP0697-20121206/2894_1 /TAXON_ID=265572 /ORGANISM="Extubocellulus spinifer, Strain CCMP396" /LENGTH=36 /DNA_ID= /DNA_START= /DNA_END= /DNA_ORIENTATION=